MDPDQPKPKTRTRINIPALLAAPGRIREPPKLIYTTSGLLVPNPAYKKHASAARTTLRSAVHRRPVVKKEQIKEVDERLVSLPPPSTIYEIPPPVQHLHATRIERIGGWKSQEQTVAESRRGKAKESEFVTDEMREKIKSSVMELREGLRRMGPPKGVKRGLGYDEQESHAKRRAAERINGIEVVALDSD